MKSLSHSDLSQVGGSGKTEIYVFSSLLLGGFCMHLYKTYEDSVKVFSIGFVSGAGCCYVAQLYSSYKQESEEGSIL